MEFDSKSYFESFLRKNLTMDNSQEIYEVFYSLEVGEEILFKNCCEILGIDREKFLTNFDGTVIFDVDEDVGLSAIAAAERFGVIEYENPDEPSYGTIKEMLFDNSNSEYMKFRQQLYHAAACDIVRGYDESEYHFTRVLTVIKKMGAFEERQRNYALLNKVMSGEVSLDNGIIPHINLPVGKTEEPAPMTDKGENNRATVEAARMAGKPSILARLQEGKEAAAQAQKSQDSAPRRSNGMEV